MPPPPPVRPLTGSSGVWWRRPRCSAADPGRTSLTHPPRANWPPLGCTIAMGYVDTGLYAVEEWTADEAEVLRRYFTNLDGPVFALVNLPEVVKGALFARYSRTAKSL